MISTVMKRAILSMGKLKMTRPHFSTTTILKNAGKTMGPKSYVHGASRHPLIFNTIGERLRMAAERCPDKEFVLFKREGIRKTYLEVLKDVGIFL